MSIHDLDLVALREEFTNELKPVFVRDEIANEVLPYRIPYLLGKTPVICVTSGPVAPFQTSRAIWTIEATMRVFSFVLFNDDDNNWTPQDCENRSDKITNRMVWFACDETHNLGKTWNSIMLSKPTDPQDIEEDGVSYRRTIYEVTLKVFV